MAADSFLVAGAQVIFEVPFIGGGNLMGEATTVVTSESKNTATKRGITVEGDETKWIVVAWPYIKPPYIIPGIVTCKIKKLHTSHIANKNKQKNAGNKKSILLVGGASFEAEFEVKPGAGAKQPPSPAGDSSMDTTAKYNGKGHFIQAADSKSYNKG